MIKTTIQKNSKKVYESIKSHFSFELASVTLDVVCSKPYKDGENILVSFCQTNTLHTHFSRNIFKEIFDVIRDYYSEKQS